MARYPRLLAALLVAVAVLPSCGGSSSPSAPSSTYVLTNLDELKSEKSMGSASAPVTIIDYSSVTCPHCATFHLATLPAIKTSYIDTGTAKYVYRDFPLNGASTTAVALAGAALARCAGNDRYFEALDLLYRAQASWTTAGNPTAAMKQALAPIGMPSEKMDACVSSSELQDAINRQRTEGVTTYNVGGTPTIIVNGKKLADGSLATVEAAIRQALQDK